MESEENTENISNYEPFSATYPVNCNTNLLVMKAKRHNEETPRESAYLYMYEYIGFNDMKL